jgi:hypothetical protein
MAVKTFSSEVLTSADTNTYLANAGLVYVKSQTIGTGVATAVVTDAFSSTYDAYKIIITGGLGSTATALKMHLGNENTANYFGFLTFGSYTGTTVSGANDNNAAAFTYAGGFDTNTINCNLDLLNPYSSTDVTEISSRVRYGTTYGNYVGVFALNSSFTGFTFTTFSGTLTGGTITVYGYRKA